MLCTGWLCLSNLPVAYFTLFVAVCESMSQIHAVCECVGLGAVSLLICSLRCISSHAVYQWMSTHPIFIFKRTNSYK